MMNKQWYPQTEEIHLDEKGVSIEFRTALEIYKAMLSNSSFMSRSNLINEIDDKRMMTIAISLGKQFYRKFNETNSKHETTED